MEGGSNGAPDLSALYAAAFTAYLADRGERELGAAYDIGRQAVAAHLSVLDLAEAHHAALRAALDGRQPAAGGDAAGGRGLPAREPVDLRERPPRLQRGPRGRPDRARARRAAALAGRRVGGAQLVADRRGDPPAHGRRRARPDRRHSRDRRDLRSRPAPAAADRHVADAAVGRRGRAGADRRAADRPRERARDARGARPPRARVLRARRLDPHAARPARLGGDLQRAALRARAHDRPDAAALAAAGRAARGPRACRRPCASARPARASSSAATSTTSTRPAAARTRR